MWERLRVTGVAEIWWRAVTDGSFYNRWSAFLSFLLAAIVGVPTANSASVTGYLQAVVVGVLGWIVLAILALPAAVAERRWRSRPARGAAVLTTLLVICVIRTPLNDVLSRWLWDVATAGVFLPRVVTNIVAGIALFSLVSITLSEYARRRAINARLERALAPMRASLERARAQADEVGEVLAATVRRLQASRNVLLARPVDFDSVRAYAEEVRRESHLLEARADATDASAPVPGVVTASALRPRTISERLANPPLLMVSAIYAVATLPFSIMQGGLRVGILGVMGLLAIDLAAGFAGRRLLPQPGARWRPVLFLLLWVLAGCAVAALSVTLLPDIGLVAYVGIVAIPGLAISVSVCTDALHEARLAAAMSQDLLAGAARDVARESARASDPLRHAVGILHGGVQGQCVILAAQADERQPTVSEVAQFRARTDAAFYRLQGPVSERDVDRGSLRGPFGSLGRVISAWRAVLDISYTVSATAAAALGDHETDELAAEAVTEAFVNAVKHSGAREATVSLTVPSDDRLVVTVASPGTLPSAERRASGLGTRRPNTRILQSGTDVVFEAVLPVASDPDAPTSPAARAASL